VLYEERFVIATLLNVVVPSYDPVDVPTFVAVGIINDPPPAPTTPAVVVLAATPPE
jgi:hypothetical protein